MRESVLDALELEFGGRGGGQPRYKQVVDGKPADSPRVQRFVGRASLAIRCSSQRSGQGDRSEGEARTDGHPVHKSPHDVKG